MRRRLPMGIDIRDGAQLECISCGLCIDACDEVMKKVGLPRSLIGWDTDVNIARRKAGQPAGFRLIRPRTILYAVVIAIVGAIMLAGLGTRATMELNSIRDRNPNFVRLSDGSIRNGYTLKIVNRPPTARVHDPARWSGRSGHQPDRRGGNARIVTAGGDAVRPVRVFVTLRPVPLCPMPQPLYLLDHGKVEREAAASSSIFISR